MSNAWASKLASVPKQSKDSGNGNGNSGAGAGTGTASKTSSTKSSKEPSPDTKSTNGNASASGNQPASAPVKLNSAEILAHLSSTYNQHLQQAKADKAGETIKVYRSLESSSQWKTKPRKDVLANNSTVDLVFELNRSIYQQREKEKEKDKENRNETPVK